MHTSLVVISFVSVIEMSRIIVHDLLRYLQGILSLGFRHGVFVFVELLLLFRMLVLPEVHDLVVSSCMLVDCECCGELFVSAELDLVEEVSGEILAVVANEVVCWPFLSHVVDGHLSCSHRVNIKYGDR